MNMISKKMGQSSLSNYTDRHITIGHSFAAIVTGRERAAQRDYTDIAKSYPYDNTDQGGTFSTPSLLSLPKQPTG